MEKQKTRERTPIQSKRNHPNSIGVNEKMPLSQRKNLDRENLLHEELRCEYTEVNNNIRHYSNLRFAIFTVYFALLGGLVYLAFGFLQSTSPSQEQAKLWARAGGFVVTFLFMSIEINLARFLKVYVNEAIKLERLLGYNQITEREAFIKSSSLRYLRTDRVAIAIYIGLLIFWSIMFVWKYWH